MKSKRHAKILELVENNSIDTQEELLSRLRASGFFVTQATVSRDIKELRLVKVQSPGGEYYYTQSGKEATADMSFKFHAIFSESVSYVDAARNIVVVKCYTGMANAACAALDSLHWKDVVGTLAGDDTIFIVMRDDESAQIFSSQLSNMAKPL